MQMPLQYPIKARCLDVLLSWSLSACKRYPEVIGNEPCRLLQSAALDDNFSQFGIVLFLGRSAWQGSIVKLNNVGLIFCGIYAVYFGLMMCLWYSTADIKGAYILAQFSVLPALQLL